MVSPNFPGSDGGVVETVSSQPTPVAHRGLAQQSTTPGLIEMFWLLLQGLPAHHLAGLQLSVKEDRNRWIPIAEALEHVTSIPLLARSLAVRGIDAASTSMASPIVRLAFRCHGWGIAFLQPGWVICEVCSVQRKQKSPHNKPPQLDF